MNKFIKEQLKKCRIELPQWDDSTTELIIQCTQKLNDNLNISKESKNIVIANYIINEPSNFTLSTNWNKGTKPPEKNMMVTIEQIYGKMIYVRGFGKSTGIFWEGWLPQKSFEIMEV